MQSNQAEQDAAWIREYINENRASYCTADAAGFYDIAGRIEERQESHQRVSDTLALTVGSKCFNHHDATTLELGPDTLAALLQGFAMVAIASAEDADACHAVRENLAAAMTPGEGESSPDTLEATRQLVLLEHQQRQRIQELEADKKYTEEQRKQWHDFWQKAEQRIQELEAERDEIQGTLEHAKAERIRHEQRLAAATKLLEEQYKHGDDYPMRCKEWCECKKCLWVDKAVVLMRDRTSAWLKGQPETATPPLDAEKVARACCARLYGDNAPQVTSSVSIIADEIRKEQGDE